MCKGMSTYRMGFLEMQGGRPGYVLLAFSQIRILSHPKSDHKATEPVLLISFFIKGPVIVQ
jgi:hypothetical protein